MYNLILIDADDTLFDYPKAELQALHRTFDFYNVNKDWEFDNKILTNEELISTYKVINHELWADLEKGQVTTEEVKVLRFKRLFEHFNLDIDGVECSKTYLYQLSQGRFLLDGAVEICKYLHSKATVVVVTNGFKEVQYSRIQESELKDYIDAIIISEEVGVSKPDPKIFEAALLRMGHRDKADVIMIGDSVTADMAGGRNYGIDTCWFNPKKIMLSVPGQREALDITYEISALNELIPIMESHR